jgi:hypothetical protein
MELRNDTSPAETAKRQRRRSRAASRTGSTADWSARLKRLWRLYLTPAMLVLSLVWIGFGYLRTYQDTAVYGPVAAGMTTADALYVLGQPLAKSRNAARERWIYRNGDQIMAIDFSLAGSLHNVLCTSNTGSPVDCPAAQGVTLGMAEDRIWYLLGKPPVQRLEGPVKIIAYPALGLTLRLEQFKVSAISRQPKKSRFAVIPQVVRTLMP